MPALAVGVCCGLLTKARENSARTSFATDWKLRPARPAVRARRRQRVLECRLRQRAGDRLGVSTLADGDRPGSAEPGAAGADGVTLLDCMAAPGGDGRSVARRCFSHWSPSRATSCRLRNRRSSSSPTASTITHPRATRPNATPTSGTRSRSARIACVNLTPCSPEQTRALNALDEAMFLFNAAIARNE